MEDFTVSRVKLREEPKPHALIGEKATRRRATQEKHSGFPVQKGSPEGSILESPGGLDKVLYAGSHPESQACVRDRTHLQLEMLRRAVVPSDSSQDIGRSEEAQAGGRDRVTEGNSHKIRHLNKRLHKEAGA